MLQEQYVLLYAVILHDCQKEDMPDFLGFCNKRHRFAIRLDDQLGRQFFSGTWELTHGCFCKLGSFLWVSQSEPEYLGSTFGLLICGNSHICPAFRTRMPQRLSLL